MRLNLYQNAACFLTISLIFALLPFLTIIILSVTLSPEVANKWVLVGFGFGAICLFTSNYLRLHCFNCPKCGQSIFKHYNPYFGFETYRYWPNKVCAKCGKQHNV